MQYRYQYRSPLGPIMLEFDDKAIMGLWFTGQKYSLNKPVSSHIPADHTIFTNTLQWLDIYFAGECPDFTPPVSLRGTEFQCTVWQILLRISYGKTMTYGEIAKEIANRRGRGAMSAQAVGGAVGHNPIGIIVPCHRVVGSNGNLTGYAGGIDKKIQLLRLEQVDMTTLFRPTKGTAL